MARISAFIGALAIALALISAPTAAFAGVFIGIGVSVNIAPPPLPVYVQPPVFVPDEIWTPGYWAYGDDGYFWVPGTWVAAPQPGYLWTPGYWAFNDGAYLWHGGYWGPHVGFYGGVNYGFGYAGAGYVGGGWYGDHFRYNTAYTNVNRTVITNVYVNRTVIDNGTTINRVSYNGGPEGIQARETAEERAYRSEPHLPATAVQREHIQTAALDRSAFASVNHGHPENAAFARPLSRENRPASFAQPAAVDHQAAVRNDDAFSRFDQQRGITPAEHPAASAYRPANAYHPENVDHPASEYRPANAYHPASAYHAPQTHEAHAPAERAHPAPEREHDRP